ncbi:MAG: ComEC family competence protein [Bacteroidetes bacterium]|nr:ComEC family competence protein [Bacteroidota bacterium]
MIPLVAGILFAHFFNAGFSLWMIGLLTTLLILIALQLKSGNPVLKQFFGLLMTLLFFGVGIYLEKSADSRNYPDYFAHQLQPDSTHFFQVRLTDYPQKSGNWVKFQAQVIAADQQATFGKVQLYIERDSLSEKLKYGDVLHTTCRFFEINAPSNPSEFDYRNYLRHQDIHHQAFVYSGHWISIDSDPNLLLSLVYQTRAACNEIIENSGMKPENMAVAKALLLGDKEMISDELMLTYSASGTLHVLAVSGLHVGIVMLMLSFILKPLKRMPGGKLLFLFFALAGIWFYTLLTGFSPSILRAAVMFSFVLIGNELQRDTSVYQSLLVSAVILILLDPHIIFQIGFLLSYLAVFGIVFFHPKIYALFFFKYKIPDKIWQLASVSVAAQLATLPLSIYCFHQFPNYFLFANLIVIPVSFVILVLGIIALFLHAVPYISDFLFYVLDQLITLMNEGVRQIEKLPYAILDGLVIQWYDALILFAVIFSIAFTLIKKSKSFFYLSLTCISVFLISLLVQKSVRHQTNSAIFYSVKDEVIIDFIQGEHITCFATPEMISNTQKMRYHIYPNRLEKSGGTTPQQTYLLADSTRVISKSGQTILFLNQAIADTIYTTRFPVTDVVYLYDSKFINRQIIDFISAEKIPLILGCNVSRSLRKYLIKRLRPDLLYDLTQNGALVINLEQFNGN